jgi:predicted Zn-dependent protease
VVEQAAAALTATPSTRAGTRRANFALRPRVFEVPWLRANAFVYPLANTITFTDAAVGSLTDEELGAIAAHELGHLTESRTVTFVRASIGFLFIVAPLGQRALVPYATNILEPLDLSSFAPVAAACAVILPCLIVVTRIVRPLLNRMEKRADSIAHAQEHEAGTYARALERLYMENLAPATTGLKRPLHPDLYDRLLAAGVKPSYARPAPPSHREARLAMLASIALLVASFLGSVYALDAVQMRAHQTESPDLVLASLAASGNVWDLSELARLRSLAGKDEEALVLYRASGEIQPRSVHYAANVAIVLARLGRCAEARDALDDAEKRLAAEESTRHPSIEAARSASAWCVDGVRAAERR